MGFVRGLLDVLKDIDGVEKFEEASLANLSARSFWVFVLCALTLLSCM